MRKPIITIGSFAVVLLFMLAQCTQAQTHHYKSHHYQVAAYYFPNYHVDKRNEAEHGNGWTEWELVKRATPRFPGHQQPKVPLWGYTDEANPKAMAQKIDAAASHGLTAFIFDWYYYDNGPFLEGGLESGFLKAPNSNKLKFAIMWANHDWEDIHPYTAGAPHKLLYHGKITPETWDKMTDYIVAHYFKNPSYWLINGTPYFSVYDLSKFISIFGSVKDAAKAIESFRNKTKAAGFPDLNMNAVVWGTTILPSEERVTDPAKLVNELGFNSVSSYVWIHHVGLQSLVNSYDSVKNVYFKYAEKAESMYGIPYYPNVSMGWDPSPRTNQQTKFTVSGYPYTGVITGNTPQAFKQALIEAKHFMDKHNDRVLTINSWNEWTEGSYIEPDKIHKLQYLDAIRDVFSGSKSK
jgi:hypothetical protein